MNYEINNVYGYNKDYKYLEKVINKTLEMEDAVGAIFSIVFVDNEEIHKLNKEYRGIDRETDVLSFAYEDNENIKMDIRVLGDIYISIPRMVEQAKEYGHSEERELAFLTVHGILHLLGYDHTKSIEDERIMFSKQEEVLSQFEETRKK